jgi:hypothetical protein
MSSLILFIISGHVIWVWPVFFSFIYLLKKENYFKRKISWIYYIGVLLIVIIFLFNPGGYFSKLIG